MSSVSKGPYLWKRPARTKDGRKESSVWIIKDGGKQVSTRCPGYPAEASPPESAQQALAEYIARKYSPPKEKRDADSIPVEDVLLTYHEHRRDLFENDLYKRRFDARIERLNDFFGSLMLSDVRAQKCKEYIKSRGSNGGARRDLEDLRAAIKHHAKEGLHIANINVFLPPKGEPRERWLTRGEAAKLLLAAWRHREVQTIHRGEMAGEQVVTEKRPLRHIARFILIALYTGSRASAVASSSPVKDTGHSFVDLHTGVFYRLAVGKRKTNKRQPPVALPDRLLAHMRRWQRLGLVDQFFVEWNGQKVASVKNGFAKAVEVAGLCTKQGNVTPHTLRHTAATWLMQQGVKTWDASGFLGMSEKTLTDVYGHHHPDFQREVAQAITRKSIRGSS